MELYLNSRSDFSITDGKNKKYTPEEARKLLEAGKVRDYNLAFGRLIRYNFDLERTKQSYIEEE